MPRYSTKSLNALATCNQQLVAVARNAIQVVDHSIVQGHRSIVQQRANVASGVSKTMDSKHLHVPSSAFDFAPYVPGIGMLFGNLNSDVPRVIEAYGLGDAEDPGAVASAQALIREHYTYVAGIMLGIGHAKGIPLTWGGNWDGDSDLFDNKFDDLGHIELAVV